MRKSNRGDSKRLHHCTKQFKAKAGVRRFSLERLEDRRLLTATTASHAHVLDVTTAFVGPLNRNAAIEAPSAPSVAQSAVDFGDFYYSGAEKVSLRRYADQFVIRVADAEARDRVMNAMAGENAMLDGYEFAKTLDANVFIVRRQGALEKSPLDWSTGASQLKGISGVEWATPLFQAGGDSWLAVNDEVIVALQPGVLPSDFFGNEFKSWRPMLGTPDQFVATLADGAGVETVAKANQLSSDARVAWAAPNAYADIRESFTPSDSLYSNQWTLNNTGQTGARVGADGDVAQAWDVSQGSSDIVVAVIDDGVQTNHPDLNIFVNVAEANGSPGVDDDNNGYTDDVNGWDFFTGGLGDNNPNPSHADDNHGTAVAGVAAAAGNGIGVSGVSRKAKIMPIKVSEGGIFASSSRIAEAVYYAAGRTANGLGTWKAADVANMSFSTNVISSHPALDAAIAWATSSGREGKGTTIFATAGNEGSGYEPVPVEFDIAPGNWTFAFEYVKDGSISSGSDTVWLGGIKLPNGSSQLFDSPGPGLPSGWTTYGHSNWTVVDDPAHAYGTGRYVAKAGAMSNNGSIQWSGLESPTISVGVASKLSFNYWVSSQLGMDGLNVYKSNDGVNWTNILSTSGVPSLASGVAYPASNSNVIAVGASTDWDYRADYSQFGSALDIVAPSSGGFAGVYTTDRTGANGYAAGDYDPNFGGTSAAAPFAAGAAAVMLSVNPNLTAASIHAILRDSADKIGSVSYSSGFNQYYGYGRVNLAAALEDVAPTVTNVFVSGTNALDGVYEIPDGSGAQLKTIPVGGANKITIEFSKPMNPSTITNSVLSLVDEMGGPTITPNGATVTASAGNTKFTWEFVNKPFAATAYRLTLSSNVIKSATGVYMDGDFINPTAVTQQPSSILSLPSGNGSPGGAFTFDFVNLPSDSNRDNVVNSQDLILWKNNYGGSDKFTTGDGGGDGTTDGTDFLQWQQKLGKNFVNLVLANAEATSHVTVAGVTISGSNSAHDAYVVPTGSGEQLRTIPLGGADTIAITFSSDVTLVGDELSIYGADSGANYGLVFEGYDALTYTASWRVADGALPHDQLIVELAEGVVDSLGAPVDPEWRNPQVVASTDDYLRDLSGVGAGDGFVGGAFRFHLNVLPGDFNLDNKVDMDDLYIQVANYGTPSGAVFTDGDFDGDGDVDVDDDNAFSAVLTASVNYTTFTDVVAPRVANVWFDGSNSTHAPYMVPTGSGEQLRTVPLGGIDTIKLAFDEGVILNGTELSVYGVKTGTTYTLDYIGNGGGVATWKLVGGATFPAEQLLLRLDDSIVDAAGNSLDGEFTNPWTLVDSSGSSSSMPSGDGEAGGDFRFRATILPGDFNRDNVYNSADMSIYTSNFGLTPATHADGDISGDGVVDGSDFLKLQTQAANDFTNWKSIESGMILVSSAADEADDADYSIGDVTLREALARAGVQAGDDVIVFRQSLSGQSIDLTLGELSVGSNVQILGLGAEQLLVDAQGTSRVFVVAAGVVAAIDGLAITGGGNVTEGGGVLNFGDLTLQNVVITGNTSTSLGGGVQSRNFTSGVASLRLYDSTVDGNHSVTGSGINVNVTGGVLQIIGSTISNNTGLGLATQTYSAGGGLAVAGATTGAVYIANSTFSGNAALYSGGIRLHNNNAPTTIVNSTIAYNTGNESGGLQRLATSAAPTIYNTIIAENKNHSGLDKDVLGSLNAVSAYNLIGRGGAGGLVNGVNGNIVLTGVATAGLAPLDYYGGPTKTHALLEGSLAIDAGNNDEADDLLFDQRRRARLVDGDDDGDLRVDIGAYEVEYDEFFASLGA